MCYTVVSEKKKFFFILRKISELLKPVPETPLENYSTILSVILVIPKAVTQNWSVDIFKLHKQLKFKVSPALLLHFIFQLHFIM